MLNTINYHSLFFFIYALLSCGFALAVLFSSNIVRMAFYLIISLASTAGLFFLAGAKFVGAMQIMIYVGGTLVLLIFGVMLTAQATFVSMKTRGGDWVMAAVVGGTMLAMLVSAAFRVPEWTNIRSDQASLTAEVAESATGIGQGIIGVRPDRLHQTDPTLKNGMSGYLLPFEIISIHLLVVLIGAAYLARTKRRVNPASPVG